MWQKIRALTSFFYIARHMPLHEKDLSIILTQVTLLLINFKNKILIIIPGWQSFQSHQNHLKQEHCEEKQTTSGTSEQG